MRDWIDCVMPCTPAVRAWALPGVHGAEASKLHIRVVEVERAADAVLDTARARWQDVHVCLLPVCPDNLSWARTVLGQMGGARSVPVMALTCDLRAVALRDLIALCVADFMRTPGCPHELRVRVERMLAQARRMQLDTLSQSLAGSDADVRAVKISEDGALNRYDSGVRDPCTPHDASATENARERCPRGVRTYSMGRLVGRVAAGEPERRRAPHPAQHHGLHRAEDSPRVAASATGRAALETFAVTTARRCALYDEPLRESKLRVVEGFEQAYVTVMLNRYGGNITQAARAAKKHRRAFWELLRKYHIDLSLYRGVEPAPVSVAGDLHSKSA